MYLLIVQNWITFEINIVINMKLIVIFGRFQKFWQLIVGASRSIVYIFAYDLFGNFKLYWNWNYIEGFIGTKSYQQYMQKYYINALHYQIKPQM